MKKISLTIFAIYSLVFDICFSQPITWQRIFSDRYSFAFRTIQASDSNYVTVGSARINSSYYVYVVKQNLFGDTIWRKFYGQPLQGADAFWVEETLDKGYIIAGSSGAALLLKIDFNGNYQWHRIFYGNGTWEAWCVKRTNDSGYVLA